MAEVQPRHDGSLATIVRADGATLTVDLSDPISLNTLVLPGDIITVNSRPPEFYYIGGRINYPGQKVFQPGITLLQAIMAAGGLIRESGKMVELSREGAAGRLSTSRFNVKAIKAGSVQDLRLQPGDRIEVDR
jgi:protein involved in polysaccharide export with SLBB domain